MRSKVVFRVLVAIAVGVAIAVSACGGRPGGASDALVWDQGAWDDNRWQ